MPQPIVQVVAEFSSEGGVETVAWELARAWDRAGVPNSVIASTTAHDPAIPPTKVRRVAPWLSRIPTRGAMRHTGRLAVVPAFTLAATRAVRRLPKAVVVSHGDCLAGDILVVHAVNAASLDEKRRAGNWSWRLNPMHAWVAARDRWMIGGLRYRRFVAVSPRVREELNSYYGVPLNRIVVIPNGIDLARFAQDAGAGAALRREFGVPFDARMLLFVGHEFDRKGLAYVIAALEMLPENVWLMAVGSDSPAPYAKLARRAGRRIVFTGPRRDLPRFYAAADAFVLPTSYETFSLVCMEAMASSVPVFATRVGGIEDYLVDGINGFAITQDGAAIARALGPVLRNSEQLARLRQGARMTAQRYGWDRIAADYMALTEEIGREKYGPDNRGT